MYVPIILLFIIDVGREKVMLIKCLGLFTRQEGTVSTFTLLYFSFSFCCKVNVAVITVGVKCRLQTGCKMQTEFKIQTEFADWV